MATIVTKEVRDNPALDRFTLENLPLLKQLRAAYCSTRTAVCIERAKFFTEYLKSSEGSGEPMNVRRAKGVNHYLSSRTPIFHDDNIIAGSSTSRKVGAPVYPEFLGLSIWPELETMSTRKSNPQTLSKEDAGILNRDVFPYWMDRTVMELVRKESNPPALSLMEKIAFFMCGKTTVISHCTPLYEEVLSKGLNAMIDAWAAKEKEVLAKGADPEAAKKAEFYKAGQIGMMGILAYARNLQKEAIARTAAAPDAETKKRFADFAEILAQVPARPARTFREAVNSLWLCHIGVLAENVIELNRSAVVQYPL